MKIILYAAMILLSLKAYAQDLETDDSFFKGNAPYEDDELDRASKKNALTKTMDQQKKYEFKVKDEVSTAAPGLMSASEAKAMDQRVVNENKRRRKAILNKLSSSAQIVQMCFNKNTTNFQGSHATVIWMVGPDGRVLDTAIKSTDIDNSEIQKCIHDIAVNLNFSEAKTDLLKKSLVEYTYKFKKKTVNAGVKKKTLRKTASQ